MLKKIAISSAFDREGLRRRFLSRNVVFDRSLKIGFHRAIVTCKQLEKACFGRGTVKGLYSRGDQYSICYGLPFCRLHGRIIVA